MSSQGLLDNWRDYMTDKICDKCKHYFHDEKCNFKINHICINPESQKCTEYVDKNDTCEKWEPNI